MTTVVLIKVVLELQQPGGVAAAEQLHQPEGIDVPVARTPWDDGHTYVPATSLAGSFRAHLAQSPRFSDRVDDVMGYVRKLDDGSHISVASPLRFLGTHCEAADLIRRPHTAVDRRRSAATATSFRGTTEHLAPGTKVTIYLQLDGPEHREDVIHALCDWTPFIGGLRTTGHGRATVIDLRQRTLDLTDKQDRRTWLTTRGPDLFDDQHTTSIELPQTTEPPPFLALRWTIVDGLHIGDRKREHNGRTVATVIRDHHGQPCVPGSTWKGVLRSRCEFILRSLGLPACRPVFDHHPTEQNKPCGTCLICQAFGWATRDRTATGQRGTLTFTDSTVENAHVVEQHHVALDRVFGGARPSKLFTEHVVQSGELTLTIHADPASTPPGMYALLTLACHDLHHGFVGIGGSTTRGLGTLRLHEDEETLTAQRSQVLNELNELLPDTGIPDQQGDDV